MEFTKKEKQGLDEITHMVEIDQHMVGLLKTREIDVKEYLNSNFTIVYNSKSGKFALTYVITGADDRKV